MIETEDPGVSTFSSDIKEDNLDIRQDVIYLDQTCRDKTR